MADAFDEIDDEIRKQKLKSFWEQNGSWIIGGAVAAVILTGVLTYWRQWEFARDVTNTAALTELAVTADPDKLTALAAKSNTDHAILAKFMAAATYVSRAENDKAAALYNEVKDSMLAPRIWRDLATLKSIGLRLDKDDPKALSAELAKIAGDKSAWRYSAREMQALLAAKAGKTADAIKILNTISLDHQAPEDAKARAMTLRDLYQADLPSKAVTP